MIDQGPQFLTALLCKNDKKWRSDTFKTYVPNFGSRFGDIISPAYLLGNIFPAATDQGIGAREEDQPYGYRWALATPRESGSPRLLKADLFLWRWGYAFWDEDRLRDWGFAIGGPFFYNDENGVFDRASGQPLPFHESQPTQGDWLI